MRQTLNWIGDVPGAGRFGFSYSRWCLLAMMFVVGPVDWFVLKGLGRQPWTWVTTTGWIGAGHGRRDLHRPHLQERRSAFPHASALMDEADGMRVGDDRRSPASIRRARRELRHRVRTRTAGGGRRATATSYGASQGLHRRIDCHQDYRGNRPVPHADQRLEPAFPRGRPTRRRRAGDRQAQARRARGGEISGVDHQPRAVPADRNVAIRTRDGAGELDGDDRARRDDAECRRAIDRSDSSFDVDDAADADKSSRRMYQTSCPSTRPTPADRLAASPTRARRDRIEQMLRERDDVACVYAEFDTRQAAGARSELNEPTK